MELAVPTRTRSEVSLENNMIVMEILDAAVESARSGRKIAMSGGSKPF